MLDELNFSHSDKPNSPNSDVHTDNCLILLLQHVSQLLGGLLFSCGPPDRNANSFEGTMASTAVSYSRGLDADVFSQGMYQLEFRAMLLSL